MITTTGEDKSFGIICNSQQQHVFLYIDVAIFTLNTLVQCGQQITAVASRAASSSSFFFTAAAAAPSSFFFAAAILASLRGVFYVKNAT
eukprot:COSAG02_NODE_349_length_24073_cov_102.816092_2_plen_89_part_00